MISRQIANRKTFFWNKHFVDDEIFICHGRDVNYDSFVKDNHCFDVCDLTNVRHHIKLGLSREADRDEFRKRNGDQRGIFVVQLRGPFEPLQRPSGY